MNNTSATFKGITLIKIIFVVGVLGGLGIGFFMISSPAIRERFTSSSDKTVSLGDGSFSIGEGFDGSAGVMAVQSDGKILVGGVFKKYQGQDVNGIVRLNSDGSRDMSFSIGDGLKNDTGSSLVSDMAVQSDGNILVAGSFSNYQGSEANNIVSLNSDGSRDRSFDTKGGFDRSVDVIVIQDDGKILVGGLFKKYQGQDAKGIIRLNSDGSRDTSFNIGDGFDRDPNTIFIQDDGKILLGGMFRKYQGQGAYFIIRLNSDGSRDTSFNMGTGFDFPVFSIEAQNDGKILVGGGFSSYQGKPAKHIIRLNSDGSRDTSFNMGEGFDDWVYDIATQSDGKILVGGVFSGYQGDSGKYVVRLNSDGSRDRSFDIGAKFVSPDIIILNGIIQLNEK